MHTHSFTASRPENTQMTKEANTPASTIFQITEKERRSICTANHEAPQTQLTGSGTWMPAPNSAQYSTKVACTSRARTQSNRLPTTSRPPRRNLQPSISAQRSSAT